LHDHHARVDDRRAAESPLRIGFNVPSRIEPAQVFLPKKLAIHVVTVQPLRAEKCDDVFPVRRGRRVGMARFGVSLDLGNAARRVLGPELLAGLPIKAQDLPRMFERLVDGIDVAIKPDLNFRLVFLADGRRDEDAIAPDYRRRIAQPLYRRLPQNALALLDIPFGRNRKPLAHAAGPIPPKARPILIGGNCETRECRANKEAPLHSANPIH
jgi:hypothetical protein